MQRKSRRSDVRTICFVTGTRAEFGLMESTLRAIQSHPRLKLQIIATGMHLDSAHGKTINQIRNAGWKIDAVVPWKSAGNNLSALARQTGLATAHLASVFDKLSPDIVLVTGDRVEAFAAATAAQLSGNIVAHVHGGDRALGQVDDALRHAITKLSHIHFPATKQSAERIAKLGEDKWRIHRVGSPGIDGIREMAWPADRCLDFLGRKRWPGFNSPILRLSRVIGRYAIVALHPTEADDDVEFERFKMVLTETSLIFDHWFVIYPNNDPGSQGILRFFNSYGRGRREQNVYPGVSGTVIRSMPRPAFLRLLADAAVLIGNSSSGIIEAASFGTPVIDVGPRQAGRKRGKNVISVPFTQAAIRQALKKIWNNGKPLRFPRKNIYGAGNTARRIAEVLASASLDGELRRKLIAY